MNLREAAQLALAVFENPWAAKPGGMLLAINTLRAALAEPTSQESRQVEPVGYFSINDYGNWEQNESNSGTPLYDAPPKHDPLTDVQQEMGATISKTETVEPVAWMWDYRQLDGHVITKVIFAKHYKHSPGDLAYVLEGKDAKPLYTAPPNQEPLTDEEIKDLWDEQNFYLTDWHSVIDFVRDIERAHGIGGEE